MNLDRFLVDLSGFVWIWLDFRWFNVDLSRFGLIEGGFKWIWLDVRWI